MKKVITYGTYDLLHYGHINLLKRAKELGDYLIVALSTDVYFRAEWFSRHICNNIIYCNDSYYIIVSIRWYDCRQSKQKKCYFPYEKRKQLLESIRYVDLVIPENNWEQKIEDVKEFKVDTFVMGDDWTGKFDFLKEYCEVIYLPRTPEISTTQIKKDLGK